MHNNTVEKERRKQGSNAEEIKAGVDEKKKTQGMRRNLGHKGCGWVKYLTLPPKVGIPFLPEYLLFSYKHVHHHKDCKP